MQLYNTLTRKVEDFKPIKENEVKLYTCGPTVYDYVHLGNLRTFVFDDLVRRVLEADGYRVKHIMNITDVGHLTGENSDGDQDKLEKGAEREGKTVWQVAEHYTKAFETDAAKLNLLRPNGYKDDHYAKATDFIDQQKDMIQILLDKGFAYKTEQAIYFDVTKLTDYGKLTGQKLSDKEVGARSEVVTDSSKHHPQDFALWFFNVGRFANHEMHWDSAWGKGFPGWHIECSAIIHATLGEPIDIHTGGVDLIGTHHTNEMAQTEAAFGHQLANYWLHGEHLLIDGQRMAKSSNNFYTLKDITERDYDPLAVRLLLMQAHYRSQSNFTWEALEVANNSLKDFYYWADLQFQSLKSEELATNYNEAIKALKDALNDDLNTPQALAILNGMVKRVDDLGADSEAVAQAVLVIEKIFGLGLDQRSNITKEQDKIIAEREEARKAQDFAKSDELRDKLAEQGIGLRDTEHGAIWYRL